MPEYRATRFINTREASTYRFKAKNDEEARSVLLSGDDLDWSGDADLVDCDVSDEFIALDRCSENGSYETVDIEIEIPGMKPYGAPSQDFARRVAALAEEGAYYDAVETLEAIIAEARTLCRLGLPSP